MSYNLFTRSDNRYGGGRDSFPMRAPHTHPTHAGNDPPHGGGGGGTGTGTGFGLDALKALLAKYGITWPGTDTGGTGGGPPTWTFPQYSMVSYGPSGSPLPYSQQEFFAPPTSIPPTYVPGKFSIDAYADKSKKKT